MSQLKINAKDESDAIPLNSLSCYIGRIVKVSDSFVTDGILYVDFYDVDGDKNDDIDYGESGSTQKVALASWTLRMAYAAWEEPPEIKYKGTLVGKGSVKLPNAKVQNASMNYAVGDIKTMVTGVPVPATPPFTLTQGNSVAPFSISDENTAEVNISTSDLEIKLTSDIKSQLPWCQKNPKDHFIMPGMKALCMAFGNSYDNLYVVDLYK